MSSEKAKVLITGAVNGSFDALTKKLTSLQKSKAGPFHVCFCVGNFFTSPSVSDKPSDDTSSGSNSCCSGNKEVDKILTEGMPIPTYFCQVGSVPTGYEGKFQATPQNNDDAEISLDDDDNEEEEEETDKNDSNSNENQQPNGIHQIAPNLFHLRGIISNDSSQTGDIINIPIQELSTHLTVAYLPPSAQISSPQTSILESKMKHPSYLGCDILLTSTWGQGMATSQALTSQDKEKLQLADGAIIGDYDVAEVASLTRPRYHFAPTLQTSTDNNSNTSFFLQSLPYSNPPSILGSGMVTKFHTSRFLTLCPVVDAPTAKKNGKTKKFIHALGIQPLWTMDRATATAVPENVAVAPNPYTDDSYSKDEKGDTSTPNMNNNTLAENANFGLSDAQTRRILSEDTSSDQYRWKVGNQHLKRPFSSTGIDSNQQSHDQQQQSAANDPSNRSLFLHGINQHSSEYGGRLHRDMIHSTIKAHGDINIRHPNTGMDPQKQKNFCFLEFTTHEEAAAFLQKMQGQISIADVVLTLKWGSGKRNTQPLPPPPTSFQPGMPMGVPPPPPPPPPPKRQRLTEEEAVDSSSLFVHINTKNIPPDQCSQRFNEIAQLAQSVLENAINEDAGDESQERITAEQEPALKVTARTLQSKQNCAFIDFASHAAASMALATLTGSTNGGFVQNDGTINAMTDDEFSIRDVQLWWAKPKDTTSSTNQQQIERNQLNARSDCWFCLDNPKCETHLIVNASDNSYICVPKGPVNKHHTLVVSPLNKNGRELIGAFLDPNTTAVVEVQETIQKLRKYTSDVLNKDLFVYERAMPTKFGYHPHINCIPIDRGLGDTIQSNMIEMAKERGFDLQEAGDSNLSVVDAIRKQHGGEANDIIGYFYAEFPASSLANTENGETKRLLYVSSRHEENMRPKFVPLQFGREVLACVLGKISLGDWKQCVLSSEEEEASAKAFRESFCS